MISKSTQGLVRSQTVESCQVIPSACQSDGVEDFLCDEEGEVP